MRLLADECCDAPFVRALRNAGFDVLYLAEGPRGLRDDRVLSQAFADRRILLTQDKDFGDLVYRLRLPAYGVILLRFEPEHQAEMVDRVIEFCLTEQARLARCFVVLDRDRARIRTLEW